MRTKGKDAQAVTSSSLSFGEGRGEAVGLCSEAVGLCSEAVGLCSRAVGLFCSRAVLLFGLSALVSCALEPEAVSGDRIPAVFTPSIAGEIHAEIASRVVNQTWSGNETVGIHSVAAGGSLPASAAFKQYTAPSGTTVTLTPKSTDQTLYYPVDGSNVNFFAFSPYTAPASDNKVTYSATDQSTQAKLEAVDFIWVKATEGTYNKKNPDVELKFAHKQSRIIVQVDAEKGVTDAEINTATATFTMGNMPTGGTYNLSDGSLSAIAGTGTIKPYKNPSPVTTSSSVTWEAIVPPHTSSSYTSRTFTFTFNGKTYTYTPKESYVAGYSYLYKLKLATSGVVAKSTSISDWTGGAVYWGGPYVMRMSSHEMTCPALLSSQAFTIQYQGTVNAPVTKVSSSATDPNAVAPAWLTASVATSTTTSDNWTNRAVTVNTTRENMGDTERTAYIHVGLEGLNTVVKVTQSRRADLSTTVSPDANCHIVSIGKTIVFSAHRAVTYGGAASDAAFSIDKLWDDTENRTVADCKVEGGVGYNTVIKLTAGPREGNAVIAVKDGNGVIRWSWHIWVTDYDYNPSNTAWQNKLQTKFTTILMDRNLGATAASVANRSDALESRGLLYQWGRKDPFPGTVAGVAGFNALNVFKGMPDAGDKNKYIVDSYDMPVAILESIQNPTTFYGIKNKSHWLPRPDRYVWINRNTNGKSEYDPCPKGWMVPVNDSYNPRIDYSPWIGFTATDGKVYKKWGPNDPSGTGITMGDNAIYPGLHLRKEDGAAMASDAEGAVWTKYIEEDTRLVLIFHYTSEGYVYADKHKIDGAYGLPVRCMMTESD